MPIKHMTNPLRKCASYYQSYVSARSLKKVILALLCFASSSLSADEVLVAVASNFIQPMKVIAERFEKETGHKAKLAFGSSGKLFAQIRHGAPFDIFLSADKDKVTRLLDNGLAVDGSEFIYAKGRLVLWSAKPNLFDDLEDKCDVLKQGDFDYFAMANPKLAPYGEAAESVLQSLDLAESLKPNRVMGENIAQTFQFVQTGNAELGFVALSQIKNLDESEQGSHWLIPTESYPLIEQYGAILETASNNTAASELVDFLKRDSEQSLIRSFGYD